MDPPNPGAVSLSSLIKDGGHMRTVIYASLVLVGGFYMAGIVITSGV